MTDPNCVFCKIANKEIPAEVIFENESVIAFMDIHPEAPGHVLLIPKEHYRWFYDVPEELSAKWFHSAQNLASQIKSRDTCDYVQLKIEGIDMDHTHIHLIPRKKVT